MLDGIRVQRGPLPDLLRSYFQASDGVFREWVLNQRRSRNPKGGRDVLLAAVFDYSLIGHGHAQAGAQLPIHCGWTVAQHTLETLLQLRTSGSSLLLVQHLLSEIMEFALSPLLASQLVLALRMAALFHAMGKVFDAASIRMTLLNCCILNSRLPSSKFPRLEGLFGEI